MQALAYEVISPPGSPVVVVRDAAGAIVGSDDPAVLLEFLRYNRSGVLRVFWDLDESIAPILRLLPQSVLERLSRFDEDLTFEGNQLYYLPERMFRVGRARFYGMQMFWPTDTPAPRTLDDLQDMADELVSTLERCGMAPSKLTSPIAVWEASPMGQQFYASLPKAYDLPENVWGILEYAFKCDRREWITAYQVGHWRAGEIFDYDLSSAYPSVAQHLADLRQCVIWKAESFGSREANALYGFMRGRLWLDPGSAWAHTSPIVTDLERMPGNPVGEIPDYYLTLDELRCIRSCGLGDFEMTDGWFVDAVSRSPNRPFYDLMNRLYEMRQISPTAASLMKGVANQLVGKLIETKVSGEYGPIRNDVYHALILAQTRVKVALFLRLNEIQAQELVAVQTDGCRLTRYIPCPGNGMGSWRNNGSLPTIVASPYKVYSGDKRPGRLTYADVVSMISDSPADSYYCRHVMHRLTLRQAIDRGDIRQTGAVVEVPAFIDLYSIPREQNRVFPKLPTSGRELLRSHFPSDPVVLSGPGR